MGFTEEAEKPNRGFAIRLDISLDNWGTTAYRYSTVSGRFDGTNDWEKRILSIGTLDRSLGNGVAAAATVDLILDNTDELVDWMMDRSTVDSIKARFKLWIAVFNPSESPVTTFNNKQLGEFVLMDWPKQDQESVSLTLTDDVLGFLEEVVPTPTVRQWVDDAGSTTGNCPVKYGTWFDYAISEDTQVPLIFGADAYRLQRLGLPDSGSSTTTGLLAAATTDSAAVSASTFTHLWASLAGGAEAFVAEISGGRVYQHQVQSNHILIPKVGYDGSTIWSPKKSQSLTADGKAFYLLYIEIDIRLLFEHLYFANYLAIGTGAPAPGEEYYREKSRELWNSIPSWWAMGASPSGRAATSHPAAIVQDLIEHYAKNGGAAKIHTASFAAVQADYPQSAAGAIAPSGGGMSLRSHIGSICQSCEIDVFVRFDGTVGCSAPGLQDYASQTATFPSIDEERLKSPKTWWPSKGERGEPYNRLYYTGIKEYPFWNPLPSPGPYDDPDGAVTTWNRPVTKELSESWQEAARTQVNPWHSRAGVQAKVRPRVQFVTDIEVIKLELGDYFKLTWTRNLGASDPYTSAIFQLERMAINLKTLEVTVEALWRDDIRTEKPYLLDDEDMLVRYAPSVGQTITLTDSSSTVGTSFDAQSAGVVAGDILEVRDASQADDVFSRHRALRITAVGTTTVTISDADLDFGGGATLGSTAFKFSRGHTTYHTSATSPTNHPDGGAMYGRCASETTSSGVYSDSSTPHKLLHG